MTVRRRSGGDHDFAQGTSFARTNSVEAILAVAMVVVDAPVQEVVALLSIDAVEAAAAEQPVVVGSASEAVLASVPFDVILTGAADEPVFVRSAPKTIVAVASP